MKTKYQSAFTIVELLVVIVVIGILATIVIVSYTGVSKKAIESSIKSDLASTQKRFALYQVENGRFPTLSDVELGCSKPSSSTKVCVKPSGSNEFVLAESDNTSSNNQTFCFEFLNSSASTKSYMTNDGTSGTGACPNWVDIGDQTWAKYNLNVGTRINGATAQTNNSILEKYCYSDTVANCTTDGALYRWDEAMQYVTTAGAQGICPAGSHIPTDNDWKILEVQLGMTQAQADATGYRGTDQAAKLKPAGASGLNIPYAGNSIAAGTFFDRTVFASLWSSTQSTTNAWSRGLDSALTGVYRAEVVKTNSASVRCLRD